MCRRLVMTFILAVSCSISGHAQTAPPTADSAVARADNYYGVGNRIDIMTPMGGDVIVAGRDVNIVQPIGGDILAAGWRVELLANADDDVRIAASEIKVDAPIRGDLTIAGGSLTLGPHSHVSGRSWLTGNIVRLEGIFDRDLHVAGATVEIGGEIRQPVEVIGEKLEILPSARILAPLTYKGPSEARIAEGAVVTGPITYTRLPQRDAQRARVFPAVSTLLFSIHVFLAGVLVLIFLPRIERSVVDRLRTNPGKSFLAGFVALVATPAAAILLIVSILGLPLGLALGALYAVALFAGVVATAFCVGELEAKLLKSAPMVTRGQQALLLLAGVLTLAVLRSMLGGLVVFASVLFGLGALMLTAYHAYAHTSTPVVV